MFESILKMQSFLEREEISLSNGILKRFDQTYAYVKSFDGLNVDNITFFIFSILAILNCKPRSNGDKISTSAIISENFWAKSSFGNLYVYRKI